MRMRSYRPAVSILICSITGREESLGRLVAGLMNQCMDAQLEFLGEDTEYKPIVIRTLKYSSVEIKVAVDNKQISTGAKRNLLVQGAKGKYVVFIDDDDEVFTWYVSEILQAATEDADCIGINGIITTNGTNQKQWFISKKYGHWYETGNMYFRTPNHISPIKRSICLRVPYPDKTSGEDSDFSQKVLQYLETESYIKKSMYHYKFSTQKK